MLDAKHDLVSLHFNFNHKVLCVCVINHQLTFELTLIKLFDLVPNMSVDSQLLYIFCTFHNIYFDTVDINFLVGKNFDQLHPRFLE